MKMKIKIKAFDANLVDEAAKKIIELGKNMNAKVSGPIPLPTKREVYTVLRSVHVNKTSREQFESRTHKRLIVFENVDAKLVDSMKRLELPSGVKVEVVS